MGIEKDNELLLRLKAEIALREASIKRTDKLAEESFHNFEKNCIEKVGRAFGVKLYIKQKLNYIYNWLKS